MSRRDRVQLVERLAAYRLDRDLTWTQLAAAVGVGASTLIEHANRRGLAELRAGAGVSDRVLGQVKAYLARVHARPSASARDFVQGKPWPYKAKAARRPPRGARRRPRGR